MGKKTKETLKSNRRKGNVKQLTYVYATNVTQHFLKEKAQFILE